MGALACIILGLGRDEWSGCADKVDEEMNGMLIIVVVVKKSVVVVGVRTCKKIRGVVS